MSEEFMYKWHKHENLQLIHKNDHDLINYGFLLFLLFQPAAYFFVIYFYRKLKNLWPKKSNVQEEPEQPIVKPIIKYEDKYIEEYKNIESLVLSTERLDSLKHTFLIENSPFGNLMMHYDHSRESFIYYSDNTIPYRFLEVASRRYVIQNNCKSIHVSMADELTEAEKKLQEKRQKEKEKELEKEEDRENKEPVKKNVFAKLKNYNTSSVRAPNSTKQKSTSNLNSRSAPTANPKTEENTNIIVKEKANRYSYEGKFANFAFLQKVDKKAIDKRYQMSFADFKKMSQKQN
jgi:hypothetical protein